MTRYHVLFDLDTGDRAQPCGVVIERADHVEIIAPAHKAFPARVDWPYERTAPDLTLERIEAGDPRYFDVVAEDLHRSFAMGEELEAAA